MKFNSIELMSGSVLINATIESGSALPTATTAGRVFFLTTGTSGLYVCDGTTWKQVGQAITNLSQLTNDVGFITAVSPTLTGTPTAPTATAGTNTTQLATTAFVKTAVTGLAPLASPVLTGTPAAPTATAGTNTTQIATTAFVTAAIAGTSSSLAGLSDVTFTSPASGQYLSYNGTKWVNVTLTTVNTFNNRSGAVTLSSSDVTTALNYTPANLVSPTFTGTPAAPTATAGTNTTQIATTAFVQTAMGSYAPLASPALTGTPTAPTATAGTNTTQIATTAYVMAAVASSGGSYAPLNSPTFTGIPTAPTATAGTNTTQLATTAYVQTAIAGFVGGMKYTGTWNASTNSPTITSGTGTKGTLYKVATAGTTTIDGVSSWSIGDMIVFNGTTWDKIDGQATEVVSFNGRIGAITLSITDVQNALGFTPVNPNVLPNYATLASPALTGIPTAPTPATNDNSTTIATTAYVQTAIASLGSVSASQSIFSYFPGNINTLVGTLRYYPRASITLQTISLFINSAPTTAIEVDLLKNGSSVFGSGSKPTISAGANTSTPLTLSTTLTSSDYLTVNILSGNGADMTARIDYV